MGKAHLYECQHILKICIQNVQKHSYRHDLTYQLVIKTDRSALGEIQLKKRAARLA